MRAGGWVSEAFAIQVLKVLPLYVGRHTSYPGQVYIGLTLEDVRRAVGCHCSHSCGLGAKP